MGVPRTGSVGKTSVGPSDDPHVVASDEGDATGAARDGPSRKQTVRDRCGSHVVVLPRYLFASIEGNARGIRVLVEISLEEINTNTTIAARIGMGARIRTDELFSL